MEIKDNILGTLGNTPLVRLSRFSPTGAPLLAKIESFNPGGSVKDRIGISMIEAAEATGELKPGMTIVEPTSGNTGLGLAIAAAIKGYKLVCTASEKISKEKIALLEAYGARVIVCPLEVAADDPRSYYKVAERLRDEEGAYLPYQYYNQANPMAHYRTTGPEIWRQTDGKVTHYVVGMGTGGTISGTGRFLKEKNPKIQVIGIDPVGSVYRYYFEHRELPPPELIKHYLTDGVGEDFMPKTVWWDFIDGVVTLDDKTAYRCSFELAKKEGYLCGSSGGMAIAGAREIARELGNDALVVTLIPDAGERYLSKLNREWLAARDLL